MTPALKPTGIEIEWVAHDLIDVPRLDRTDDIETLADLGAAGDGDVPILAFVIELVHAGAGRELQALELAVKDEVRNAAEGVRAVGGRSAARDDVDGTHQRRREGIDIDRATLVGRRHAKAVEKHERALGTEAAHVQIAATARSE